MVLLCTGVIIAGSTLHGSAVSYDVTATVPATPPASAALITSHYHAQHVTQPAVRIAGVCPANSYVKLFRSAVFSGVSQCTNNNFQVQTNLDTGLNHLQAKVYNVTDDEGPVSSPVSVYYDNTSVTPEVPPEVPESLSVRDVERSPYKRDAVRETSDSPTITGFAPPYADIVVTFHSDVVTCGTTANADGWWSCTLDKPLPEGMHRVDVTATTTSGEKLVFPTFRIKVNPSIASLLLPMPTIAPLVIVADYRYQAQQEGNTFAWTVGIQGGAGPYKLTVDWGDKTKITTTTHSGAAFTVSHVFSVGGTYQPVLKATDSQGSIAILQLSAVVNGPISAAPSGPHMSAVAQIRQYLWIVWPAYGAVVLMVISFWLGELGVMQCLAERRRSRHGVARRNS